MDKDKLIEEIVNRQSVRSYKDVPVEREKIIRCIHAGHLAPSACNKQPWHFTVVDDKEIKQEISSKAFNCPPGFNKFAKSAPVMVIVSAEKHFLTHAVFGGLQGVQYYLLDIGASVENFLLEATRVGLGCCWLGWFNEKVVKNVLGIPEEVKVVSIITVGYPESMEQKVRIRKPLDTIYSFNHYSSTPDYKKQ
ncbi:MAG: nitroreductase family protein [bacterium]